MMRNVRRGAAERRSAAQWEAFIGECEEAGQTAAEFCGARGLSLKSFEWWRWALRVRPGAPHQRFPGVKRAVQDARRSTVPAPRSAPPTFVELLPRAPVKDAVARCPSGVEIILPGGQTERRIRVASGFDAATLRRVVQALEQEVTEGC